MATSVLLPLWVSSASVRIPRMWFVGLVGLEGLGGHQQKPLGSRGLGFKKKALDVAT